MKQARFIYNPRHIVNTAENPWGNGVFNTREMELPAREGLALFRCDFGAVGAAKVVLRATALGVFNVFVNGERIGNEELKPGWTDYRHRVMETAYDITDLCAAGNTLVAEVSVGWWSGRISFGYYGYKPLAFCGEIEITYEDGHTELLASDETWLTASGGPVRTADIWDGEYYDARIPHPAADPAAYVWNAAELFTDFTCEIVPFVGEHIRVREHLPMAPVSAVLWNGTEDNGTEYGRIRVTDRRVGDGCEACVLHPGEELLLDMGQEMVGWARITVRAAAGTRVSCQFAELLNDSGDPARGNDGPEGSHYVKNYRSACARETYVTAGEGEECYAPSHTFFGFRYVSIHVDADTEIIAVNGEVVGSDLRETAYFSCSDPEVNRLFSNIVWGMRSNYLSIPTDCPQRDERLGWSGDTEVFCGAASYLADIGPFMHKWLGDARDSQKNEGGGYCDVIPRVWQGSNSGNTAWADAGLIVPYRLWLMYGDTAILEEHYDSMEYYMEFLSQYGLEGPNTAYGDWLNYDHTDPRYLAVCYYAYDAALMTHFSRILGKYDKMVQYGELFSRIREHFLARYTDENGLTIRTQTACLLALRFGLVEGELADKTRALLRERIESNNYTLSTGFVGTGVLNQTLSENGMDDLAYSLLLQTADPSWLYSVRQGATTVWERWNSYTLERGFGDVAMNSFNHYAYGAVAEWMFGGMAGILPDEEAPGFAHFVLRPCPDRRTVLPEGQKPITSVQAAYDSPAGVICSAWDVVQGQFVYTFEIPAGASARVELLVDGDSVKINDVTFTAEQLGARRKGDRLCFELAAGQYTVS